MIKCKNYGSSLFPFIYQIVFWTLIWYFITLIVVSNFVICLLITSCIFTFFMLMSANYILPKLVNSLKNYTQLKKDVENKSESYIELSNRLEKEQKHTKKYVLLSLFVVLFSLISIASLWWGFYLIIKTIEISVYLKLYIVFVIVFDAILYNLSKNLKKQIISKML